LLPRLGGLTGNMARIEDRTAMTCALYGHPFSSYTEKVLVALDEMGLDFEFKVLGPDTPDAVAEFEAISPMRRMPVLVDRGEAVFETSIIIEHLALAHPDAPRLLPENPKAALEARLMDRFFDNYVMTPMLRRAFNASRPEDRRDPLADDEARAQLDAAYGWLDGVMAGRTWAAGDAFSLADCGAAPALLFAHWAHPIGDGFAQVHAYRQRLLRRPSFARIVDDARPYRRYFPLGAPEQD
jgi:glutathione S-transferase